MGHLLYQDFELVRDAQAKYFQTNNFPADGGSTDKWARYKLGPFFLKAFPNFNHRVQAIVRHDIHHVVNDLDASNLGEGLIAGWELGSGCGKYWISWFMESQGLWFGILLAPRQTWSRFLIGRHSRNFFNDSFSDEILDQTVGDLRKRLLPPEAVIIKARLKDRFAFLGYSLLGLCSMLVFFPIVLFFTIFSLLSLNK